jgi:cytochrome c-type biogenesis protein
MTSGALGLAFAAGVVSFLSPCVLPLVPGYLAAITGLGPDELERPGAAARRTRAAIPFVVGFGVVFVALGLLAGALGDALGSYRGELARASGIVVVALGFAVAGALPLPILDRGASGVEATRRRTGSAVALGAAFAFCWTPCVGPVLASILLVSASGGALQGGVLLLAYAVGLALPLLAVAVVFSHALSAMRFLRDRYQLIRLVAGSTLVVLGLLLFFDRFWVLNVYVNRLLQALGLDALPTL